jgi:ABC-type sulfate transport system substrate-binding protein
VDKREAKVKVNVFRFVIMALCVTGMVECAHRGSASDGWQNAQKTHFADGGTFDQIYGK